MVTDTSNGILITSHASGLIIPRVLSKGEVQFCIPSYYKRHGRVSKRQVVETGEANEGIFKTLERALTDEIAEAEDSATMSILSREPVYTVFKKDERNPGGTHLQGFFLVAVEGKLRSLSKMDGDEELGPMIWMEAQKLIIAMEKEGTVPTHLEATKAALAHIADKSEAVYHANSQVLVRCHMQTRSPVEEAAMHGYAKWF